MPLTEKVSRAYETILREELVPAMGCTEPIAIAYAASILREVLGCVPERLEAGLSGNLIKNVKSVVVPATGGMHGISAALAAGIVSASPAKKLEVLSVLGEEDHARIASVLENCTMELGELATDRVFDLRLTGFAGGDTAQVWLADRHTKVVKVTRNGEDLLDRYRSAEGEVGSLNQADRGLLNVQDIVEYADTADLEPVRALLERQIELNMAIAEEGIRGNYGAGIGKMMYADGNVPLRQKMRSFAAAGSDARMNGCEKPVCIISGSGNQGMTASIPLVVYAREKGVEKDRLLRALLVSDLVTIHQKTGIGCLSAYCGAISAGCGCGAGICYLNGGGFRGVAHTLVNAVAILSGTVCDGAKASCAAKISMAVEAGLMGYDMFVAGHQFYGGDGIVTKGVENTIRNVGRLARQGMSGTDKEIIRIMLGKEDETE